MAELEVTDAVWPILPDQTDIYRLLDKPTWITPSGQVTSLAFILKPSEGDCLSVGLRGERSPEQFCQDEPYRRNRCVGVAHSTAGVVKEPMPSWVGPLDVVQDEEYHACLTGLPLPIASDLTDSQGVKAREDIEYVANEMAKRVSLFWRKPK